MSLIKLDIKWVIAAITLASVVGAVLLYGRSEYRRGVTETTASFIAADKRGSETVNETAEKELARIGSNTDPDELLRETGGLRDD